MGDSKQEINRKFSEIIGLLNYRPGIAVSLNEFLLAAPGQNAPGDPAIDYALSKLWIEDSEKSP